MVGIKTLTDGKNKITIEALTKDARFSLKTNTSLLGFRKDLRQLTAKRMGVNVNSLVRVGTSKRGEFVLRKNVKKPIINVFGNNKLI